MDLGIFLVVICEACKGLYWDFVANKADSLVSVMYSLKMSLRRKSTPFVAQRNVVVNYLICLSNFEGIDISENRIEVFYVEKVSEPQTSSHKLRR